MKPMAVVRERGPADLDLQSSFNQIVHGNLGACAKGLGFLFLAFGLGHWFTLAPPEAGWMAATAFVTAAMLFCLGVLIKRLTLPVQWAHPIGAAISGLVLLNILVHLYLTEDACLVMNLGLLIIGVGSLFLSLFWLALVLGATVVTWALVEWILVRPAAWLLGFQLLSATVLSLLIYVTRIRIFSRVEERRFHEGLLLRAEIREREQQEKSAREAEQRYRTLFEEAPVMQVVARHVEGLPIIEDCNGLFLRTVGLTRSQVLGRCLAEFFFSGGYAHMLNGTFATQECELVTSEGAIVYALLRAIPERDCEGQVRGIQAMFVDINKRKEAEEALRTQSEHLKVVNEAKSAFLQRGDWREASAILLRGALSQTQSASGFVGSVVEGPVLRILAQTGMNWGTTADPDSCGEALESSQEAGYLELSDLDTASRTVLTSGKTVVSNTPAAQGPTESIAAEFPRIDRFLGVPIIWGTEVVGMIGVANRKSGYGTPEQSRLEVLANMSGVLYDSYRRQVREASLEQQLRQAQKMEAIGRLTGGIAHDLNNVLTGIIGYAQLMKQQPGLEPRMNEDLVLIYQLADRAAGLTGRLLAFSRKQTFDPVPLNLNILILNISKMLSRLIGEDVELKFALSPDLLDVHADPGQIEQVLMNLAVNARDAMPDGGKLIIETANVSFDGLYDNGREQAKPGSYVMMAVTDTGSGMDEATLRRIFEPFFTTKGKSGTGLGLSTVDSIVKEHNGYISVHSELNHGTTFKIYLQPAKAGAHKRAAEDEEPAPRGSETILLVEDEPALLSVIARTLQEQGYMVLSANDPRMAEKIFAKREAEIALLLTDVVMPGCNGRELYERLMAKRPGLKVLYMSGYPDNAIGYRRILGKDVAFICKPFTSEALARKVRRVLDTRPGNLRRSVKKKVSK